MTDQPDTMLEYHFRKLARVILVCTIFFVTALFGTAAGLTSQTQPGMALAFIMASLLGIAEAWAVAKDGRLRRALNFLLRTDVSDLKRPDEQTEPEVLAE